MIDEVRLRQMAAGAEELEKWLLDMLREGVAGLSEAPPDYWEDLAGSMVNAKLGGLARRIRTWPGILAGDEGPRQLVGEIADLYLFVQAFRRLDRLSDRQRMDLLTMGGVNLKKETVRQREKPVNDRWLVIGQIQGVEDNLKYRRTWLLGAATGRAALLLDYAWGREDFAEHWVTGSVFKGELCYYPSHYPQRALVQSFEWSDQPYDMPPAFAGIDALLLAYARALVANPWLYTFPARLADCRAAPGDGQWALVDRERRQISLTPLEHGHWELLALSAGREIELFGEWNGADFLPLSVTTDQRLIPLTK